LDFIQTLNVCLSLRLVNALKWWPGYRFTKGLTQNLNVRTNLELEYNIKSLNYIQKN